MNVLNMCRVCRGNAQKNLGYYRCKICKMTLQDYDKADRRGEVDEMEYLYNTWKKCGVYLQISTGYKKLDQLITRLFGAPHKNVDEDGIATWRNYSLIPGKVIMTDFVVIRSIDESQLLINKEAAA